MTRPDILERNGAVNIQTPNVSGYLTRPLRSEAEAKAEAEQRVLTVRGSYDAPGFEACVEAETAELAQAAFLEVATTATLIKLAKSKAHELDQRDYISQTAFDELLLAECKHLTKGDVLKAQLLASAAKEI